SCGNRRRPSGHDAIPRAGRAYAGRFVMSSPAKSTCPRVGRKRPLTTLRIVDLPAPFGPMMTVISPCFASRPTSHRTWVPAYPASISVSRSKGRLPYQVRLDNGVFQRDVLLRALRGLEAFIFTHGAYGL